MLNDWNSLVEEAEQYANTQTLPEPTTTLRTSDGTDYEVSAALVAQPTPLNADAQAWADVLADPVAYDARKAAANQRLKDIDWLSDFPGIDWLVEERFHRVGLAQLYGPSYSGKTLVAIGLALSVAAGVTEWMGHALKLDRPQHVVYVAAEGGPAFWVHVDAWLKDNPQVDRSVIREHFHVLDGGEGDMLEMDPNGISIDAATAPHRLWEEVDAIGTPPALVVYDTQIDLSPGLNENDNSQMVLLMKTIKRIADTRKHLALVIHHTGHDEGRARGASGQKGKADVQVAVRPLQRGTAEIAWSTSKIKGSAQPEVNDGFVIVPVPGSKGAVAGLMNSVAHGLAVHGKNAPEDEQRASILAAVAEGITSGRKIADHTGIQKDKCYGMLRWLVDNQDLVKLDGNKGYAVV